ncbi:MAG: hypothetical protein CMJ78_15160 [Planctomycetaceae bacterium]|nr:hypothetical protein [Planctomycetaceae bacterium]
MITRAAIWEYFNTPLIYLIRHFIKVHSIMRMTAAFEGTPGYGILSATLKCGQAFSMEIID